MLLLELCRSLELESLRTTPLPDSESVSLTKSVDSTICTASVHCQILDSESRVLIPLPMKLRADLPPHLELCRVLEFELLGTTPLSDLESGSLTKLRFQQSPLF